MTDDELDRHIRAIIAREGGWVDDPDDSGGPTNYGITLAMWRQWLATGGALMPYGVKHHREMPEDLAVQFYRWYFRTQGLDELIEEFGVPDELVPLVMDMRTLHSLEGCREVLRNAASYLEATGKFHPEQSSYSDPECVVTLFRILYMLEVAERRPKDRKFVRGWMHRALKAIGMWPPKETVEV